MADAAIAWPLGISLSISGSALQALGLLIQKFSHTRNLKKPLQKQKPYVCQPIWVLGFLLFVGSNLFDLAALSLISQSLVAPLGSTSLVVNAIVSPCLLKEKLTCADIVATILIIVGITGVIVLRDAKEFDETLDELIDRFEQTGVIIFLCTVFTLIVILFFGIYLTEWRLKYYTGKKRKMTRYEAFKAMTCGRVISWFLVGAYPSLGATVASLTILFAKASGQVVTNILSGENEFTNPWAYFILAVTVFSAISQIVFINSSLKVLDALFHIPMFFVVWNIFSIAGGGLYWGDFDGMVHYQIAGSAFGFLLICFGVVLLSLRARQAHTTANPWQIEDKKNMWPEDMEARRQHVIDQLTSMGLEDENLREVIQEYEKTRAEIEEGKSGKEKKNKGKNKKARHAKVTPDVQDTE